MIRVLRGREPSGLARVRAVELPKLRKIARARPVTGDDVTGYRVVAKDLWERQHEKCCYCEIKVTKSYNDVEHFRPKGRADRRPGCTEDHGYFWLAFTWSNLLFACDLCNRTSKNDGFPLKPGSRALGAWQGPPGKERPLLLDPAHESGVGHIQFVPRLRAGSAQAPHELGWDDVDRWTATPRRPSERAQPSIDVFGLNHAELQELYLSHVRDQVGPYYEAIRKAMVAPKSARGKLVQQEVKRTSDCLFRRSVAFAALSYDAMRFFVPDSQLAPFGASWPAPSGVGAPPPRPRRVGP